MNNFKYKTPNESIGLQFWKLHTKWQKRIVTGLSPYKITHTQFVIMASILWFQDQSIRPSQSDISKVTGIEKMTLSKAIGRLEGLSFVRRVKNNKDTRSICVSLTDEGLKLTPILLKIVENIDVEIFATKRSNDNALFGNILKELLENSDK